MKQVLLLFMAMFFFLTGKTQDPFNEPRIAHDSLSCDGDLTTPSCNLIPNPAFSFTSDSLEAFSNGVVFMWQDVNNLTTDINGALSIAGGMSWNLPTVPSILNGQSYASMFVDNQDKVTEGISGRISVLEEGKKYAYFGPRWLG